MDYARRPLVKGFWSLWVCLDPAPHAASRRCNVMYVCVATAQGGLLVRVMSLPTLFEPTPAAALFVLTTLHAMTLRGRNRCKVFESEEEHQPGVPSARRRILAGLRGASSSWFGTPAFLCLVNKTRRYSLYRFSSSASTSLTGCWRLRLRELLNSSRGAVDQQQSTAIPSPP